MAAIFHFLFAVIFLAFIGNGCCQPCTIANITISETKTGKTVANKPEWQATIKNNCVCTQSSLILSCDDFQTVEAVDPSVLSKSGGECLVKEGQTVDELSFNYAWDTSYSFKPISSIVSCS